MRTIFYSLILILLTVSCSRDNYKNRKPNLIIEDGKYVSTEDKNSTIEIKENKFIMHYTGKSLSSLDIFEMKISNSVEENGKIYSDGNYLILKKKDSSLIYSIVLWDKNVVKLIYLPRGNSLNYRRIK